MRKVSINYVRWRAEKKIEAEKLLEEGKSELAMKKFIEAVDITPQHAHCLIRTLKKLNIEFYVAPYEADA